MYSCIVCLSFSQCELFHCRKILPYEKGGTRKPWDHLERVAAEELALGRWSDVERDLHGTLEEGCT